MLCGLRVIFSSTTWWVWARQHPSSGVCDQLEYYDAVYYLAKQPQNNYNQPTTIIAGSFAGANIRWWYESNLVPRYLCFIGLYSTLTKQVILKDNIIRLTRTAAFVDLHFLVFLRHFIIYFVIFSSVVLLW